MAKSSKFEPGQLVCTRGIRNVMVKNGEFYAFVLQSLYAKYLQCDWGDCSKEDAEDNDNAVKSGDERIFAVYSFGEYTIWIITEWDRSVTTVLFPDEY